MDGYEHGTISPLTSIDYAAYLAGDMQRGALEGKMHDVLHQRGFRSIHDLAIRLEPPPPSPALPVIVITAAASAHLDRVRRQDPDESYTSVLAEHRAPKGPKLRQGRSNRAIGTPIGKTQLAITAAALDRPLQDLVGGNGIQEIRDSVKWDVEVEADVDVGGIERTARAATRSGVAERVADGDVDEMQKLRIHARFAKREGPATYLGHMEFDLTQLLFKVEKQAGLERKRKVEAMSGPPRNMPLGF